MICEMRLAGTPICRDSSVGVMPSSPSSSARISPGCIAGLGIGFPSLMVVDDLDIRGARSAWTPFETNTPLLVDANGILPCPIAFERFQAIVRQCPQVGKRRGGIQYVQTLPALPTESLERPNELALRELLR